MIQQADSGLRQSERFDRPLLIVAIAALVGNLQGYANNLAGIAVRWIPTGGEA